MKQFLTFTGVYAAICLVGIYLLGIKPTFAEAMLVGAATMFAIAISERNAA